ncbi:MULTISPECIES: hypothetical protein [unclassified Streptosporangium]|nr:MULTISPECIES: hypothetical protein [unclassified Streptosporangium]
MTSVEAEVVTGSWTRPFALSSVLTRGVSKTMPSPAGGGVPPG